MSREIKEENVIGIRYGKLVILEYSDKETNGCKRYKCQCDCGNITVTRLSSMRNGSTKSCGCLNYTKDGKLVAQEYEYKPWGGMKQRCYNKSCEQYKHYGGRGITVCNEWLHDYRQFVKDMGTRPQGYSIERMDNDKGYSPSNCKWATIREQNRNTSRNNKVQGVAWDKDRNKWRVYGVRQKSHIPMLGRYVDYDEAVSVRKQYEKDNPDLFN